MKKEMVRERSRCEYLNKSIWIPIFVEISDIEIYFFLNVCGYDIGYMCGVLRHTQNSIFVLYSSEFEYLDCF